MSRAAASDLTVKENLVLAARSGPFDLTRLEWIFGFFPPLRKFWLSRAGSLSGGQKQMLSIARAIVEPRKLLPIDEPTKGLAPAIVMAPIECFAEIKRSGATIFILAQNYLQALMGAASRAAGEIGLPLLPGLLHPDRWLLWLGLLFIASVYFFPTGIVGRLRSYPKSSRV